MERGGQNVCQSVGEGHTFCALSRSTGELSALGSLATRCRLFLELTFGQPSQHPQVMRQHTPADSQLAMSESFAADRAADEVVNDNADTSFGLRATSLQLDELPGCHALF